MRMFEISFHKKNWNASFLLFLILIIVSFGYYATATEETSEQNFFYDTDQDGLSNEEEKAYGTDPNTADTDSDGYSDGVEVESGYDPLIAAPGDRVLPVELLTQGNGDVSDENNVTLQTTAALAEVVQNVTTSADPNESLDLEDIDEIIQNAAVGATEEIVLPEISIDEIKVKKVSKKLDESEREEEESKNALEYVTTVAYLAANNSPVEIASENDANRALKDISVKSMLSLNTGDYKYLDDLEEQGSKLNEQIKDLEVPESMLDLHVKGLQLSAYAAELKKKIKTEQGDPMSQVSNMGNIQALMSEFRNYLSEVNTKFADLGIQEIPIGLSSK